MIVGQVWDARLVVVWVRKGTEKEKKETVMNGVINGGHVTIGQSRCGCWQTYQDRHGNQKPKDMRSQPVRKRP